MVEAYVTSHVEQGINTIQFFHPQSNSLPAKILQQLAAEINSAGADEETKVIVLQSAGEKAFCSGASFEELMAIQNEAEGLAFFSGFANVINAMRKCPKFIIGSIQGKCVGGGVGLAAATDYAIATNAAHIKLSELSIGIGPFVIGPVVEKKIGAAAFSALAIDATQWRNAHWAKEKGLFAEVHESTETLNEAVYRLAHTLSQNSPQAMSQMKKIFWSDTNHWDELLKERATLSGQLVLSNFTKKAIAQFKAGKP